MDFTRSTIVEAPPLAPVSVDSTDAEPGIDPVDDSSTTVLAARPAPHRTHPAELWHPDLEIVAGVVPPLPEERVAASELEDAPVTPPRSEAEAVANRESPLAPDLEPAGPAVTPETNASALPPPVDLFSKAPAVDPLQGGHQVDPGEVSAARGRLLEAPVRRRVVATTSAPARRRLFGQPVPSDPAPDHRR